MFLEGGWGACGVFLIQVDGISGIHVFNCSSA